MQQVFLIRLNTFNMWLKYLLFKRYTLSLCGVHVSTTLIICWLFSVDENFPVMSKCNQHSQTGHPANERCVASTGLTTNTNVYEAFNSPTVGLKAPSPSKCRRMKEIGRAHV